MAKPPHELVRLRLIYRGAGPVIWSGGPSAFGLQDKDQTLHLGAATPDGGRLFDFATEVKPEGAGAPVFVGPFVHGPANKRFLYLSWRNRTGEYAQRLILPLGGIAWADIRAAHAADRPLVGELDDWSPRATSTGANIGGTRPITWRLPADWGGLALS
jgi:Family of unknown function (DUF5990)